MYPQHVIVREIKKILNTQPKTKVNEIARTLRISRHTIMRALRSHGLSFRSLGIEQLNRRIHELSNSSPPLAMKEIAFELGFPSLSSFSHYARRHNVRLNQKILKHSVAAVQVIPQNGRNVAGNRKDLVDTGWRRESSTERPI